MIRKYLFLILIVSDLFGNEIQEARALVESTNRTILSSEIGGKIISLSKNNGDYFKKGQVLVEIDCAIYKAEKEKIKVKRDLTKIKLEKNIQLQKYNSVGKFEVQTSKLELKEQNLALNIAEINVSRCQIKAPYTGRVVQRVANQYQNIKPQEELLEIVSSNSLELRSVVPATWLSWLKIGQKMQIKIDELDLQIESKVMQIDSVVDPKSQTINIRAKINSKEKIIAGMSASVEFEKNQ